MLVVMRAVIRCRVVSSAFIARLPIMSVQRTYKVFVLRFSHICCR
jgi:hypothetical protein